MTFMPSKNRIHRVMRITGGICILPPSITLVPAKPQLRTRMLTSGVAQRRGRVLQHGRCGCGRRSWPKHVDS